MHLPRVAYTDIWAYIKAAVAQVGNNSGLAGNEICYTPIINMPHDRRMMGAHSVTPGWLTGQGHGSDPDHTRPNGQPARPQLILTVLRTARSCNNYNLFLYH